MPGQKTSSRLSISCIVPAYNEEKNIRHLVDSLLRCSIPQEIIVVNDGSTDETKKILESFEKKIKLITYRKNHGKGYALFRGVKAARGEIVVFIDADIRDLKNDHLRKLTQPILKRKTNYVLGVVWPRKKAKTDPTVFPQFTGQRAYLKEILVPFLPHIKKTRYGVEFYLNQVFKRRWGKVIYLSGLTHLRKDHKLERSKVLPAYIQQILEISKTRLEMEIDRHKQLRKVLRPKEIKSVKTLRQKVDEIKDKEVSELIKDYVLPYLKKITQ
jgi:glycosyltransferase involved in cell wall biosynthesis